MPPRLRVRSGLRSSALTLALVALAGIPAMAHPVIAQSELAQSGEPSLTLEAAIAQALRTQASVQGALGDLRTAEWGLRAARAARLPSASMGSSTSWQGRGEQRLGSLTSGELGFAGQPTWLFSSWNAGISLNLSGPTLIAPREAALAIEGAEARIRGTEASIAFEVTRSYIDVLRREQGVRLAESELERAQTNASLADSRVFVGSSTALDARQAEVATGRARIALLRESGELEGARITLRLLLGFSAVDPLPPLSTRFELEAMALDASSVLELALRSSPELFQLRSQAAQSDIAVQSARAQFLPTLSLSAGWGGFTRRAVDGSALVAQGEAQVIGQRTQCLSQNDLRGRLTPPLPPLNCDAISFGEADRARILDQNRRFPFDFTGQPPSVSLSVSVPLFQNLQRQRQLEVAQVNRSQAHLRAEERERTLAGELARGMTTLRTALEAARLEAQNLDVARAQLFLARDQYEVGLTDFLQLTDSEAVLARAERETLGAVFAVHEALASLELLVGTSLRNR